MDNHVHFVRSLNMTIPSHESFKTPTVSIRAISIRNTNLVGHAWQGRFKSVPMDESHCWNAIRYVERNPVRAGLVKRAEDYLWSSAAAHCGLRDDLLLSGDCPLVREITDWSEWLRIEDDRMDTDPLSHADR